MTEPMKDLKAWTTLRALACQVGIIAVRTDPADGPRMYFAIRHGVPRQFADLTSLRQWIEEARQAMGRRPT